MKTLFNMIESLAFNASRIIRTALAGAAIWLVIGWLPAVAQAQIVVNSNTDGFVILLPGQPQPCRLRDAITAANTNLPVGGCVAGVPGLDVIRFDIGTGTPSIRVRSQLPAIIEEVFIDGGTGGATRVELDGTQASALAGLFGQRVHGLYLATGGSTIRNLVINRFNGNGIVMTTDTGGHISDFTPPTISDPSLPTPPPCFARPAEPDCRTGGGGGGGIDIPDFGGADANNKVVGCFIGTDKTGAVAMGNGSGLDTAGIVTDTDLHTIGGPTPEERNVISGNIGHGLILGGRGHQVIGNFIGTDASGALALGNQLDGINIAGGQFSNAVGAIGATSSAIDPQCGLVIDSNGNVANERRECGNKIAFNGRFGVITGFNRYEMLSNSIFSNGDLGIDVDTGGVTPNDPVGSSRNFPLLTSRQVVFDSFGRVRTRLGGSITNRSSQRVIIQIFNNSTCDPSGNGEGSQLVRTLVLTGNGSFSTIVSPVFGVFTATSTTTGLGSRQTSEFSLCR